MPGLHAKTRFLPRRRGVILAAGLMFAFIGYGLFLAALDRRVAASIEEMRLSDPVAYLEHLRKLDGFAPYLARFVDYYGFDSARPVAPVFMVGRWTLRSDRERISALVRPECTDPMTFEYGRLEILRDGVDTEASYRIDGQTLVVTPSTHDPFRVRLISYGATIDHLELQPPGREQIFYAYRCMM